MIWACWDEISTDQAGTDFTQRYVEIKFHPGKAGQFSTSRLLRFVCIFSWKTHRFPLI